MIYITHCKETEIARSLTIVLMFYREHGVRVLSFHAATQPNATHSQCSNSSLNFLNITKLFLTYHDRNRIQGGVCGAGMRAHTWVYEHSHRMWNEQRTMKGKKN